MGYQTLVDALLAEGDAKAREIEARADASARERVEEAARQADREADLEARQARMTRERERRDLLGQAEHRARVIRLSTRWAAIEAACDAAEQRVDRLAGTAWYVAVLDRLAEGVLREPLPDPIKVVVHTNDAETWRPLLARRGVEWEAESRDDVRCGLEVVASGGRARYRTSFRSRLERVRSELIVELDRLWSGDAPGSAGG